MRFVTKILFPVLLLLFLSCTKEQRKPRQYLTGYSIAVAMNEKLSNGQIIENSAPVGVIHVWKADNKNYEILSVADAVDGYATDKSSDRLESAYYSSLSSPITEKATEGKYFIFIMLDETPATGKFAYSYTSFEVIKGQQTTLKKTFTSHVVNSQFEDWHATE